MSGKVNTVLLSRAVNEHRKLTSFDELCTAMAASEYGTKRGLSAYDIAVMLIENEIDTTMDKPSIDSLTPPPKPLKPEPVAAPEAPDEPDAPREIKVYDEGGKGRKQCSQCKKYVGVRQSICVCGHVFPKGNAPAPKLSATPTTARNEPVDEPKPVPNKNPHKVRYPGSRYPRTAVPAGKPYHDLRSTTKEDVIRWVEQCRTTGIGANGAAPGYRHWLTPEALMYWVGYYFFSPLGKPEEREQFAEVRQIILEYCGDEGRAALEDI